MSGIRTGLEAGGECLEVRFGDGVPACFSEKRRRGSGVCALAPRLLLEELLFTIIENRHSSHNALGALAAASGPKLFFLVSMSLKFVIRDTHHLSTHRGCRLLELANHIHDSLTYTRRPQSTRAFANCRWKALGTSIVSENYWAIFLASFMYIQRPRSIPHIYNSPNANAPTAPNIHGTAVA
jgi:hypothetical protein